MKRQNLESQKLSHEFNYVSQTKKIMGDVNKDSGDHGVKASELFLQRSDQVKSPTFENFGCTNE